MKPTNRNVRSHDSNQLSTSSKVSSIRLTLTLTLLCGLAVSASAQNSDVIRIARETGFTIPPKVQTSIVLKSSPDAACDLHAEGVNDRAQTLRFYANGDGYLKIHASAKQESQEVRAQLDCTENGKVVRYPLHLRAGSSPTNDMPAPRSLMPTPKGSRVLPALTEEEAQQLSDEELFGRGYLPRPDAVLSPDAYAVWRDRVSRPINLIPPHSVSTDISHSGNVQEGPYNSANWSGYEAHGSKRSYMAVQGEWNVPSIGLAESGFTTYSSLWVGLDGNNKGQDLVQAGSEQDAVEIEGVTFASYSTWTELLPNQPTSQGTGLGVNAGDDLVVSVYIGDSAAHNEQNGGYGWFSIWDFTSGLAVLISTPLSGTYFNGISAEWIMERPTVSGVYSELSNYIIAAMTSAGAKTTKSKFKDYGAIQNRQITMYENFEPQPDNDLLSGVVSLGKSEMVFNWYNFH